MYPVCTYLPSNIGINPPALRAADYAGRSASYNQRRYGVTMTREHEPGETSGETGPSTGRRRFMRIALLGGAATLAGVPTARVHAAGEAAALLISCMDFRLIEKTERYMTGRGLRNQYDHVILAGASLGVLTEKYPAWGTTFWEHLEVAIQLHKIHKVIVMDHRDCGAYKVILGEDLTKAP